jgi:excisionase family DNA binding protein
MQHKIFVLGDKRMQSERDYLTVKQIADQLGVSVQAVRNWINSGELEAIDLGHGYRIHKDEYQRFLQARKTSKKDESDS